MLRHHYLLADTYKQAPCPRPGWSRARRKAQLTHFRAGSSLNQLASSGRNMERVNGFASTWQAYPAISSKPDRFILLMADNNSAGKSLLLIFDRRSCPSTGVKSNSRENSSSIEALLFTRVPANAETGSALSNPCLSSISWWVQHPRSDACPSQETQDHKYQFQDSGPS